MCPATRGTQGRARRNKRARGPRAVRAKKTGGEVPRSEAGREREGRGSGGEADMPHLQGPGILSGEYSRPRPDSLPTSSNLHAR